MKMKSKVIFVLICFLTIEGLAFGQTQRANPITIPQIQSYWKKNALSLNHYYIESDVTSYSNKEIEERERVRALQEAGVTADTSGSSISMVQERPYTHIEVRDGIKKAEANIDSITGIVKGPLWYFDGKRTHLLTGTAIQNAAVFQQAKRVKDTIASNDSVGTPAIDVFSAILGMPLENILNDVEFQMVDSSKLDTVIVKGTIKSSGTTFVATLNGEQNYLPVRTVQHNGRFNHINQVSKTQNVKNNFVIENYKIEGFEENTLAYSNTVNVRRLSLESQKDFFNQLDALIIGRIYNQDTKASYNLDAPLKNFDGEQGMSFRRTMGWFFILCLASLISIFAFLVAGRQSALPA